MKRGASGSRACWLGIGLMLVNLCVVPVLHGAPSERKDTGYVSLFNGKDLAGWVGDPGRWSVVEGFIRGHTSKEFPLEGSTYLVWDQDRFKNFVLKFDFRVANGNSGLLYRGERLDRWRIDGYQVAIDNGDAISGRLWDSYERGLIAETGEFVRMDKKGKRHLLGKVGFRDNMGKSCYYRQDAWNRCTVVARGNHIAHYVNGFQTVELIDDDPERRSMTGHIAFQLHQGPPMTVDFRNIRIKKLADQYGQAVRLFDAETLKGWRCYPTNTQSAWRVQDGQLAVEGGAQSYIRTAATYRDFVLRIQYRHAAADGGSVLARMTGEDRLWPNAVQVPLEGGGCESATTGERDSSSDTPGEMPSGRAGDERGRDGWQECELVFDGRRAESRSTGSVKRIWKSCPDREGHIGLTSAGGPMQIRNIVLIPLQKPK